MKKNKKGFTVVELLLTIGIIGIVSAMGLMLTKETTTRAFNSYYYNAYINLYNAIADAIANGESDAFDIVKIATNTIRNPSIEPVIESGVLTVVTRNDVEYECTDLGSARIGIKVSVPQRKTRNNGGVGTMNLLYINDGAILVPRLVGAVSESNPDIQNRRDLLPTYIDNGIVGRTIKNNTSGQYIYHPIPYYSYREAYCRLNGNNSLILDSSTTIISCVDIATPNDKVVGFLKVQNPNKSR